MSGMTRILRVFARKTNMTPTDELRRLVYEYMESRTHWQDMKVYGCGDPFWEDGANLNLTRNHCIYYRRLMEDLCIQHQMPMPDLSPYPIPPKVAEDYMAPYGRFPNRPVCRDKTMQLRLDFD